MAKAVARNIENPTDSELICAALAGEADSFRELVLRHQDYLFGVIWRRVADESVAKDLAQETFLRSYKALASFRGDASFRTWLVSISMNVISSYFSSRRYKEWVRSIPYEPTLLALTIPSHEEKLVTDQLIRQLHLRIAKLKPIYREAVVLCHLEELSYEEAALRLGIPVGTVCSRVNKALALLRKNFEKVL